MDIAGAKALKKRLGPNGTDEAPTVPVDVPASAPPIYRWTGVEPEPASTDADDEPLAETASLFSRLGLSFR